MSHFTIVRTSITDGSMLKQALLDLGYTVNENDVVRGYMGNKQRADYVIKKNNGYDIGFILDNGKYSLIADFWGTEEKEKVLLNKITQQYSCNIILQESQNKGFTVEEKTVMSNGTVKIVVNRWV